MHAILRIQEVVGVPSLNQSREERSRPLDVERVGRAELFLIADQDDLLGVDRRQKRLILLDHGCLVHYDTFESAVCHDFRRSLPHRGHNDRLVLNNLALEGLLVLEESLELRLLQLLDFLDIVAEKVDEF